MASEYEEVIWTFGVWGRSPMTADLPDSPDEFPNDKALIWRAVAAGIVQEQEPGESRPGYRRYCVWAARP